MEVAVFDDYSKDQPVNDMVRTAFEFNENM